MSLFTISPIFNLGKNDKNSRSSYLTDTILDVVDDLKKFGGDFSLKNFLFGNKNLKEEVIDVLSTEEAVDVMNLFKAFDGPMDEFIEKNKTISESAKKSLQKYGAEVEKEKMSVEGLVATSEKLVRAQEKVNNSLSVKGLVGKLGDVLKALGSIALNVAAVAAAMFVLQGAYTIWDNWAHAAEKAIEKGKEAKKVIDEINNSYSEKSSYVDENKDTIVKLRAGVDPETNKNISLTSDEYAQYLSISNELADLFPQLVSGFDSQGNAMLNLSGNAETATSQLEALIEQERQLADFKISQNLPDQFAGIVEQNKILQNNLDKHQKDIERYTNLQNIVRGNQNLESLGFKLTGGDNELGNYQIKLDSDFEGVDELNKLFKEAALDAGISYNQTFQDSIIDPETNKVVSQWWTDLDFVTTDQYEKFIESFSALLTESDIDISGKLSETMLLANQDIKEIQANWNSIVPSLINSMSLYNDYNEFDEGIQQLICNAISNIDFQSLTDEQIKAVISDLGYNVTSIK